MPFNADVIIELINTYKEDPLFQQEKLKLYEDKNLQKTEKEKIKKILIKRIFNQLFQSKELEELLQKLGKANRTIIVIDETKVVAMEEKVYKWLSTKDLPDLINIQAALATKVKAANSTVVIKDFSDLVEQALIFFAELLTGKPSAGGLLERFLNMLGIKSKEENPEMGFSKQEAEGEYSDLYNELGPAGRKIYREGLAKEFTSEQHLNKFLCVIAKPTSPDHQLYTKGAHLLLKKAEDLLFQGQSPEQLAQRVLDNAYKAITCSYGKNIPGELISKKQDFSTAIINTVQGLAENLSALKEKIIAMRRELPEELSGDHQDHKNRLSLLYKSLQNQRVKLLHLVNKWDAFGKAQVLSTIDAPSSLEEFSAYYTKQVNEELEKFISQESRQSQLDEEVDMQTNFASSLTTIKDEQIQNLNAGQSAIDNIVVKLDGIATEQTEQIARLREELGEPGIQQHKKAKEEYIKRITTINIGLVELQTSLKLIKQNVAKISTEISTLLGEQPKSEEGEAILNSNLIVEQLRSNSRIKQKQDELKEQAIKTLHLYSKSQRQPPVEHFPRMVPSLPPI